MSDQSAIKRALVSDWKPTDREGYELLTDVFINAQCYGDAHIEKAKAFLLELPHDWYSKMYKGHSLYDIAFQFAQFWRKYRRYLDNLSSNELDRGLDEVASMRNEQETEWLAQQFGFKNYQQYKQVIEAPENVVLEHIITQDLYDMGYWITRDDTAEHEEWVEILITSDDNPVMFRVFDEEAKAASFCYEKNRELDSNYTVYALDSKEFEGTAWLVLPPKAPKLELGYYDIGYREY